MSLVHETSVHNYGPDVRETDGNAHYLTILTESSNIPRKEGL